MPHPCEVKKGTRCKDGRLSLGMLTGIAVIIVAVGVLFVLISAFAPMTSEQSTVVNSLGIPIFIFGLVMFGILLTDYAKKAE